MKRVFSLFIALSIMMINFNITISAEESVVTPIAESGKYTWNFTGTGESENVYNVSDEYADLKISLGSGDSISADKGIVYSGPSCKEKTDSGYKSAADTNRYIFIKPSYSGTMYIKISFPSAKSSTKGRIWYNTYESEFDEIDLTALNKGAGTQIGSDVTDAKERTLSFDVEAGKTYSLHTYVYAGGFTISEMYYESEQIIGKTATPTIKTPIISSDISISGTCEENATVSVKINDGKVQSADVAGTEWSLAGLVLNVGDTISVTAQAGDYKESSAATATVVAEDSICSLAIAESENGIVTSNQANNNKISKGSTVILTAIPNDKYKLNSLTVNGETVAVDKNNQYNFVINDTTEVNAVFEEKPYHNITLPTETENGTIVIKSGTINDNGTIKAVEGDRVTFSVKPNDGYRIKSLTYKTENGETKEFKYGDFFDMPTSDVTINAEFKKEDVVSYVDTSTENYDRLTLMVDEKPFFFNGVQVRADNAIDQLGFDYDSIRNMYLQASKDGYTVVNSQIRWSDVQPDKEIYAAETGQITDSGNTISEQSVTVSKDGENSQMAYFKFNLPQIEENTEYAAVKFRVHITNVTSSTALSIYDVTDGTLSNESVTSPEWNLVTSEHLQNTNEGSNGYFDFNVADFVNAHKNENSITLAVACDNDSAITICGAGTEGNDRPQLKLSRDDVYDWTHLDKILDYAHEAGVKFELLWFATDTCQQSHEVRLPYYVHANYQKSLKADGTPARNLNATNIYIMCKNDPELRAKEKEVLETVFDHIADYTAENGYGSLVVGCQVANETAVGRLHSGSDDNKYFGHCYCDICQEKLANSKSESTFREDTLWEYLNNLSSAVKESKCSVWTRENNYMTTDTNVLAYNEQKRNTTGTDLDFIGLDPYSVTSGADHDYIYSFGHESCTYKNHTYNYAQGKNLPMVMEFGGNNQDLDESIIACLAGGGYLNVYELLSGKEDFGTYVAVRDSDGKATGFEARTGYTYQNGSSANWSESNWIERVRNMNTMLNKVQYQLASKKADGAGGNTLMFFNPKSNETTTSTKSVRALDVTYNTNSNGVGIAIEESKNEIVLLSTKAAEFVLKDINKYGIKTVETGYFNGEDWVKTNDKDYTESNDDIKVETDDYDCIRIETTQEIPKEKIIYPISGKIDGEQYSWLFGENDEAQKMGAYNYNDEYGDIRIGIGTNDTITQNDGVHFSGPSCSDSEVADCNNAQETNRYILIKPTYSGTLTMKVRFDGITGKAKGRFYYNDYGTEALFDDVDLSKLQKSYTEYGAQIGSDISDTAEHVLTMKVEAGHTYAIHSYVYQGGVYLSEMYYTLEKTTPPDSMLSVKSLNVTDSSLNYEFNIDNEVLNYNMYIALYDSDGRLIGVTINEPKGEFNLTVKSGWKLKIMLWDKITLEPIQNAVTYTTEDIKN